MKVRRSQYGSWYMYGLEQSGEPQSLFAEDTPKLLSGENQDGMVTGAYIGLLLAVVIERQNSIQELNKSIERLENN